MTFRATLTTILHGDHRYAGTIGDWADVDTGEVGRSAPLTIVKVSELGDWRYEALVAIHELVEAVLCSHRGITDEAVTTFDKAFEQERTTAGESEFNNACGEPGDHPSAPYRREHFFATTIERLMAAELGVDWTEYEAAIDAAMEGK